MASIDQARKLVEHVRADFPDTDYTRRPVHTVGIAVKGYFEASPIAKNYCTAEHFQGGRIPVTVRYSNGIGSPTEHDYWSDVRGMATRFHLDPLKSVQDRLTGRATDLVMMTLGEFFTPDVESFLNFTDTSQPTKPEKESPWAKLWDMLQLKIPLADPYQEETYSPNQGLLKYANSHRFAQLAVFQAGLLGAPTSYARAAYHAVHTFIVTDPDGLKRYVRFSWQPVAGVKVIDPERPPDPPNQYLHPELRNRLQPTKPSTRFILQMEVGESGDHLYDPTRPWPRKRLKVFMGTISLEQVAPEEEQPELSEKIAFNPCRLTPGIDLSEDPILRARKDAYEYSREQRGGTSCPFHSDKEDN